MQKMIHIPGKKSFEGFFVTPKDKKRYPGLIVIQEIWGLNNHIKDVSARFANEGYVVLSPDLLSETGIAEKIDEKLFVEMKDPARRDEA